MNLIVDNSSNKKAKAEINGVERSFVEAVIYERASEINRSYLASPSLLKTMKIEGRFKGGLEIIVSVFNKIKRRREKYAINVLARRLSLNSFQPPRCPIINLH